MYKIYFYVPESHLEEVKQAMFAKGAGKFANYDSVAWQTLGKGQFRPLENSSPHIGEQGLISQVAEYKVELICEEIVIKDVVAAMKAAHPYEEPAFGIWQLVDIDE